MRLLLRRLRGVLGMALTWSLGWATAGAILASARAYVDARTGATGSFDIPALIMIWGAVGFVAGGMFYVVLSIAERRPIFDSLKGTRIAAWGALAGSMLPAFFTLATANPPADIAVGAVLGAASAVGSLWIARSNSDSADRWSLDAGTGARRYLHRSS